MEVPIIKTPFIINGVSYTVESLAIFLTVYPENGETGYPVVFINEEWYWYSPLDFSVEPPKLIETEKMDKDPELLKLKFVDNNVYYQAWDQIPAVFVYGDFVLTKLDESWIVLTKGEKAEAVYEKQGLSLPLTFLETIIPTLSLDDILSLWEVNRNSFGSVEKNFIQNILQNIFCELSLAALRKINKKWIRSKELVKNVIRNKIAKNRLYELLPFYNFDNYFNSIVINPNIGMDWIRDNLDNISDIKNIAVNPNLDWPTILLLEKKYGREKINNLEWHHISKNPNMTLDIILANMDRPWNYNNVLDNPSILLDDYIKYFGEPKSFLGDNPNLTIKDVLNHPELLFSLAKMSSHPNITWDDVVNNPIIEYTTYNNVGQVTRIKKFFWQWDSLAVNKNIDPKIIEETMDKSLIVDGEKIPIVWLFGQLSYNPNITERFVEKFIDKPWNFKALSKHPNISWNFVRKHDIKPWNYEDMSSNINITTDIFLNNQNLRWNKDHIIINPAIDQLDKILEIYPRLIWSVNGNPDISKDFFEKKQRGFGNFFITNALYKDKNWLLLANKILSE